MTKHKWGAREKAEWLGKQAVRRSYFDDVCSNVTALKGTYDVQQYGTLEYPPQRYPLWVLKSPVWDKRKPMVLITGGVHGYETSGVHGALEFLETCAIAYCEHFNIVVAPCVSPWGYETINRWNPHTFDPNRSFYANSPAQESAQLMAMVTGLQTDVLVHIDLHETTDTDNTVFRPALAARDAVEHSNWNIPDGFYLVGDSEAPVPEFQRAIIESVRAVTHIASADPDGKIIGVALEQEGVVNYPTKELGLCAGFSGCRYGTTTEVYPDSAKATDQDCIAAQVAAIVGGLDYVLTTQS